MLRSALQRRTLPTHQAVSFTTFAAIITRVCWLQRVFYRYNGDRITVRARFSAPVQTGPGAHPTTYAMGTGSFPGIKRPGRGIDHPPPPSTQVKERVELYLYSKSGPSWPVIGWTVLITMTTTTTTTANRTDQFVPRAVTNSTARFYECQQTSTSPLPWRFQSGEVPFT
jgi:hypothetical protein